MYTTDGVGLHKIHLFAFQVIQDALALVNIARDKITHLRTFVLRAGVVSSRIINVQSVGKNDSRD